MGYLLCVRSRWLDISQLAETESRSMACKKERGQYPVTVTDLVNKSFILWENSTKKLISREIFLAGHSR